MYVVRYCAKGYDVILDRNQNTREQEPERGQGMKREDRTGCICLEIIRYVYTNEIIITLKI